MIIRVYRARVRPGRFDEYGHVLRETAIPHMWQFPGLVALHIGTPLELTLDEYLIVSVWRDLPALLDFAGDNWRQAVILPDEAPLLQETNVYHYTTLDDSPHAGDTA